jgi:hypothetical protein
MYRGSSSSPIFDVPEFPTLRRVKPLPKRRRTSDAAPHVRLVDVRNVVVNPSSVLSSPSALSLPALSQDATTEEIVAHADALSAQMALQSYYMPMLGGVQDLFAGGNSDLGNRGIGFSNAGVAAVAAAMERRGALGVGGGREEDEDHGDGDYIDHLQQPGNTKKRKVPANASSSPHGGHDAGSGSGGEDDPNTERSIPTRFDHDNNSDSLASQLMPRQKMSAVTRAGLQHKEMLKNRKRQLAAVLGALSHGDTLALDQALSANYPFAAVAAAGDPKNAGQPKIRLSRRFSSRLARAGKALGKRLHSSQQQRPGAVAFPQCEFTFSCPSASEWWLLFYPLTISA